MEILNRDKHEAEIRKAFRSLYGKYREEFLRLLGDPPDLANVPESFWERFRRDQEAALVLLMVVIGSLSYRQHGLSDELALRSAENMAAGRAPGLARRVQANKRQQIAQMWARLQEQIDARPATTPEERRRNKRIREELTKYFAPEHADGLVETETTAASVRGGEGAMAAMGLLSDLDEWETRPHLSATGPCPLCEPLDGTPRSHWQKFAPSGPPLHPRCVCTLRYFHANEG